MANDGPFLFYSALHGRPVLDPDGNLVGRFDDLAVTLTETFPAATALLIRRGRVESFRLTARWRDVESVDLAAVRLRVPVERLVPGRRLPSEPSFWVGQALLDRQIVDTSGAKVVRVNDLHFLHVPTGDLHLVHVDVGFRGLVRRLGWSTTMGKEQLISWRYVQPLTLAATGDTLQLTVTRKELGRLHPAELADILTELDGRGRDDDPRVRHPAVPPDRRGGARAAARARARGRAHLLHLPGRPRGPPAGRGHDPPPPPLRPRRSPRGDHAARPRVGPTRRHPRARRRGRREVQPPRRSRARRPGQAPRRRHRGRRPDAHDGARMEVEARPRALTARAGGRWQHVRRFLVVMGPGIITANVDNDAGGITTYSLAGARYGYALVWSLVPITVALVVVQEMCARMGVVTGKGLADLIRENFGVRITFYAMVLLLLADLGNTVAEFAGVAASLEIFGVSRYLSVPLAAAFVWWLVVYGSYRRVEQVFLLACLFYLAYVASGVLAAPGWTSVLRESTAPHARLDAAYVTMLVGLVGTTIAPWMQFYQQAVIVEKGVRVEDYPYSRLDVVRGCIFTDVVAFFIIVACAATQPAGGVPIEPAADPAPALRPLAGAHCAALFAFGLFNASLFSASVLPLATAYSVCEALGWEAGVSKRMREAPHFYALYTGLIALGAAT